MYPDHGSDHWLPGSAPPGCGYWGADATSLTEAAKTGIHDLLAHFRQATDCAQRRRIEINDGFKGSRGREVDRRRFPFQRTEGDKRGQHVLELAGGGVRSPLDDLVAP